MVLHNESVFRPSDGRNYWVGGKPAFLVVLPMLTRFAPRGLSEAHLMVTRRGKFGFLVGRSDRIRRQRAQCRSI